jgi:hypothetical protein
VSAAKEGKVEGYLVEQVKARGGFVRKTEWVARRGCPDQFVAFPNGGAHGFVETKARDGVLDGHQEREIARLRKAGVKAEVVWTREQVDDLVERWWRN